MTVTSPPTPPPPPPAPPGGGFPPAPSLEPPPERRSAAFGGTRPPSRRRRRADGPPHMAAAELSLAALTAAAVYGFSRIFEDFSFLWPLLVIGGAVHLTTAVLRRRGVGIFLSFLAVSGIWALLITWLFFLDTTLAGLPTGDTLAVAGADIDRAWSAFHELLAPAPVLTGFVLAAALAVGVGAFLSDWAAFRMWSTREAVVPSLTLFVFATLLAGERQRVASAALYLGAVVLFVLVHRVARLERSNGWVTSERASGGMALLRVGISLAVVAVLVGVVLGPHLPGAGSSAIVDWRGARDTNGRVTVSPLVDIRTRLVQRSDTEVFRVASPTPEYWRMTALDDFDGNIWRSSGTYDEVQGSLPFAPTAIGRNAEQVRQAFTIQNLSTLWLPAAFQPVGISAPTSVRYQADTSTLIVDPSATDADGLAYTVQSLVPSWTAAQLRAAGASIPPGLQPMLDLPADFSRTASDLARQVVTDAGARTPYDEAMALQTFFRDTGGFVYDLNVKPGHSDAAIDDFLDKRRGYCEQFAGTFAAMARSLGIPARVAVGFTWGDEDPNEPGTYQVRGRNAHAWPEVYLGRYGWVAFEPTPGRGAPNATGYTGVPPSQEAPATGGDATGEPTTTLSGPTTTAATDQATVPPDVPSDQLSSEDLAAPTTSGRGGAGGPSPALGLVALLVVGAGAYLLAVPGSRALADRRRRTAAAGRPAAEVGLAWRDTRERLAMARLGPEPDETHAEVAARVGVALPDQAGALDRLATAADAATYGPDALDEAAVDAARADAASVRRAVDARVPRWRRVWWALDPRRPSGTGGDRSDRHTVDRPHG